MGLAALPFRRSSYAPATLAGSGLDDARQGRALLAALGRSAGTRGRVAEQPVSHAAPVSPKLRRLWCAAQATTGRDASQAGPPRGMSGQDRRRRVV